MTTLARRAFDHRADLLAALVYLCLAYLSFNALADYANGHHLFPEPWGGYAFAVAIDGSVLYAFISFRRAQVMAGVLLVVGAATTYLLQRWHAERVPHPLIVAGVVPGLMVLVTLAWHLIREASPEPVGSVRVNLGPGEDPGPTVPVPRSRSRRQQAATTAPSRPNRLSPSQQRRVAEWVAEGRTNVSQMARDLGVTERVRKFHLAPLVRDLRATQNGDRPKVDA